MSNIELAPPPKSDFDLFTDDHLESPYAGFQHLRDMGPLVHLTNYDVTAFSRYDEIKHVLENWQTFSSGAGVSLNDLLNKAWTGTLIATDPPYHSSLRAVLNSRVAPRQIRKLSDDIKVRADALVEQLLEKGSFDAMKDLAFEYVPNIVIDLIGFPEKGSENLLEWAEQIFNVNGPEDNKKMQDSVPGLVKMFEWLKTECSKDKVKPGGFASTIHEAVDNGDIRPESAVLLMAGYSIPGIDTTIGLIGNAIKLFADHPEQWDLVRANPEEMMRPAITEILRMEAPVQWFTRVTKQDYVTDGVLVKEGSRIMLLFGAGNRDERHYEDPNKFDVTRDPMCHLSFGGGIHGCPGQHLAQLQANLILTSLAKHVKRFELNGTPERTLNNTTRAFAKLPITIHC